MAVKKTKHYYPRPQASLKNLSSQIDQLVSEYFGKREKTIKRTIEHYNNLVSKNYTVSPGGGSRKRKRKATRIQVRVFGKSR